METVCVLSRIRQFLCKWLCSCRKGDGVKDSRNVEGTHVHAKSIGGNVNVTINTSRVEQANIPVSVDDDRRKEDQ